MAASKDHYPWKRYWTPREQPISLEGGYLVDRSTPYVGAANSHVRTLEELRPHRCLLLLGEPGIGKTTLLREEAASLSAECAGDAEIVKFFDLAAASTDSFLARELFDKGLSEWRSSGHDLTLCLDSFDECLLRIPSLPAALRELLGQLPVERLRLLLACRPAVWPASLEEGFRQLWGDDAVEAYSLCPLTQRDVEVAATAAEHDAETFVRVVEEISVSPLAARPVTLKMLLRQLSTDAPSEVSQVSLYEAGCLDMCRELGSGREAAGELGELDPPERRLIASRIAAVFIFGNYSGVAPGVDRGDLPERVLSVGQLSTALRRLEDPDLIPAESVIREVLDTALFQDHGYNVLGFSHQTYAEFLAAWFVRERDLSKQQVLSLLTAVDDPDGRLIPQLAETAGWVAAMRPDLRDDLTKADPRALIRSSALPEDRASHVAHLLDFFKGGEHFDEWQLRTHFWKLRHDALAEQLRPFIVASDTHPIAQGIAIEIAEACRVQALQEELLGVATDASRPGSVREFAAFALRDVGDRKTRAGLRELALDPNEDDQDDELKGAALSAVFPGVVSAAEVLSALTPSKNPDLIGAYSTFMSRLADRLTEAELPDALDWVAVLDESPPQMMGARGHLARAIVERSLEHLDNPTIASRLGAIVLRWLETHRPLPGVEGGGDDQNWYNSTTDRRTLGRAVVEAIPDPERQPIVLYYSVARLLVPEDGCWILDQAAAARDEQTQSAWGHVLDRMVYSLPVAAIDRVLVEISQATVVGRVLVHHAESVVLESEAAETARSNHITQKRLEVEMAAEEVEDEDVPPSVDSVIDPILRRVEAGESSLYPGIDSALVKGGYAFNFDLDEVPRWQQLSDQLKQRVAAVAPRFLAKEQPHLHKRPNRFSAGHLAGVRALGLLAKQNCNLEGPSDEVLASWRLAILTFPGPYGDDDDTDGFQALVSRVRARDPDGFLQALADTTTEELHGDGHIRVLEKIEHEWDADISAVLLELIEEPTVSVASFTAVIRPLVGRGFAPARELAARLWHAESPGSRSERSVAAFAALVDHSPEEMWPELHAIASSHADEARSVIETALSFGQPRGPGLLSLPEPELADLYVVLHGLYPPDEGSERYGLVEPQHPAAELRGAVLQRLREKGTWRACEAIEQIGRALGESNHLRWTLDQAKGAARRKGWTPPSPEELMALSVNRRSRLVNDGTELTSAVVESLGRLEAHFRGETPIAFALWDGEQSETPRPKGEETFSDFVKWFLDQDLGGRGIVLNREVQIRRWAGARRGQRTDIHVDAVSSDSNEVLSLIIECKGSWHSKLDSAMETQLVGRYMAENSCRHGLYLVGWFDGADSAHVPAASIDEYKELLREQARRLSDARTHVRALVVDVSLTEPRT